jgi:methylase of polypeptide subunit release factors
MPQIMLCGAFSSLMRSNGPDRYLFSAPARARYLDVLALLEDNGFEVFSAHRADSFGENEWIETFVERDLEWASSCDVQLVMLPADEHGAAARSDGTMIEMGYAQALGKPVVILADDVHHPDNSFFLRSFAETRAAFCIEWGVGYAEPLIRGLRSLTDGGNGSRRREQRTEVDDVIDDLRRETEPHLVHVAGLGITVLPGVLSPRLSHAPDALIDKWVIPTGCRVLDLGCGSGVLGLAALAQGAGRLVALDINPAAVATTELNLRNLGFRDRGEARLSDTYSALQEGEIFDVLILAAPYWNREAADDLEKSCFDLDYQFLSAAVRDAHRWLAPAGSMYIIFSDQGDVNAALDLFAASGMKVHRMHLSRPTQPGGHIRIIWELKHQDELFAPADI